MHTNASKDGTMSPPKLIERCLDQGIDVLAVTDHNEIRGALAVREEAPFPVIVGEEIKTLEGGEIIGLFLRQRIAPHAPAFETVAQIRSQGGLVYLPHPFDMVRSKRWSAELRTKLLQSADIIEVFNARNLFKAADARAGEAARHFQKVACAGADAHLPQEIGPTVVFLSPFRTPAELLASLRQAKFITARSSLWTKAASWLMKLAR